MVGSRELRVLDGSTQTHLLYYLAISQRKVVAEMDNRDILNTLSESCRGLRLDSVM